jgi:hypothetical protein
MKIKAGSLPEYNSYDMRTPSEESTRFATPTCSLDEHPKENDDVSSMHIRAIERNGFMVDCLIISSTISCPMSGSDPFYAIKCLAKYLLRQIFSLLNEAHQSCSVAQAA